MDMRGSKPRLLIVDDEPENIALLARVLKRSYKLTVVTDGRSALELAAAKKRPDLILLDVMMPGMDGYEVCGRLKADKTCRDIPVIFITAMSEIGDETRGFEMGAADYIRKPFHPDIVEARIRTHLELKRHRDHLKRLAEQRSRQITHMERLSTMGILSAGVCHEISNYLSPVISTQDLLEMQIETCFPPLMAHVKNGTKARRKCDEYLEKNRRYLSHIREGVRRINTVIETMRTFSRSDDGQRGLVSIEKCVGDALDLCANQLKNHVTVCKKIERRLPQIYGNKQQMEQVLVNLFRNAVDAMRGAKDEYLGVSATFVPPNIRVTVEDTGPGIPTDRIEAIWEPFFTTKEAEKGTGLGLSICKRIIRDHDGNIRVENRTGGGARFVIDLPVTGISANTGNTETGTNCLAKHPRRICYLACNPYAFGNC